MRTIDVCAPVPELIDVLHKYQIPVALVHKVFEMAEEKIKWNSIPENRSKESRHPMGNEHGDGFLPDEDK